MGSKYDIKIKTWLITGDICDLFNSDYNKMKSQVTIRVDLARFSYQETKYLNQIH